MGRECKVRQTTKDTQAHIHPSIHTWPMNGCIGFVDRGVEGGGGVVPGVEGEDVRGRHLGFDGRQLLIWCVVFVLCDVKGWQGSLMDGSYPLQLLSCLPHTKHTHTLTRRSMASCSTASGLNATSSCTSLLWEGSSLPASTLNSRVCAGVSGQEKTVATRLFLFVVCFVGSGYWAQ